MPWSQRGHRSTGKISRASAEVLEPRLLMAFGLTTSSSTYTVNTGANLVFTIARTKPSGGSVGDLMSMQYNGTELEAPFSATSRYSHYESGLGSNTAVSAVVDPSNNWIEIICDDSIGTGVIQYYIARNGFNNIYMATYAGGPGSPSPGEMRFITYTNHSVLTNAPAPSNNTGSTKTVESSDVFGFADGTTSSKYYGEYRAIDAQSYGLTGGGFGVFMDIGNRETSSGGPFYKDIDYQTTSAQSTELYTYVYSGHSQTENFRPGLHGPYALEFTTGGAPAAVDYSFISGLNLTGYVTAANRGALTGTASGMTSGLAATIGLSNASDQYWGAPNPTTGAYSITGIIPGTYTETLYQGELAVGTVSVTITAGTTAKQNIVNTQSYLLINPSNSLVSTPVIANPIFQIGAWDGTPLGFLNADKITTMHPTDSRMSAWADSTGLTNFIVGTDTDSDWPMAEWHSQNSAAPWVDTDNRITFTLTAAQATTAMTLRIGLTRLDSERPTISVNGGSGSSAQNIASEPDSRGLTTGNWRGNNALYTFSISTSAVHSGTNTIDIYSTSGSTGTLYSGYHIYDAIDLVPTSSLTNAPHVASITLSPTSASLNAYATQIFTASAKDQFGNPIPANFTWTDSRGVIDGAGDYTAPRTAGSATVTATSGSINGTASITVTTTAANTPPTIATPATATPSVVPGTNTSTLTALGADDDGASNLTYTWSIVGTPPGTVGFSVNGTNAAKTTVATFNGFGTYTLQVTITDGLGLTATSQTTVKVQGSEFVRYQNDVSSGATLPDTSGSNNPGSATGSFSFSSGVSGNALHLTGGNGILPANLLSGFNDFTIAAWVKLDALAAGARVFEFGNTTSGYMFLTLDDTTTLKPKFGISSTGSVGEQDINAPSAVTAGTWTHVAVTLLGNTATLYINGLSVATNSAMTTHPVSIGNTTTNLLGKSFFNYPTMTGSIDDFQIYGRGLSSTEILTLAVPAIVTPAAASPATVAAKTSTLTTLGSDFTAGEPALIYTWSTTGTPPATVSFDLHNGTNAGKSTVATFAAAGTYDLVVTIVNPVAGVSVTSPAIIVTVEQTLTSLTISPTTATPSNGHTTQFTPQPLDQFQQPMPLPQLTWTIDSGGVGTVDSSGLYTAPSFGSATVRATSGSVTATAAVTVVFSNIAGTPDDDIIRLVTSGNSLNVYINNPNTPVYSVPLSSVGALTVSAGDGNDLVTVDLSGGVSPIPSAGLTIDGGNGTNNRVALTGTTINNFLTVNASSLSVNNANVTLINDQSTELDPVATNPIALSTLTINANATLKISPATPAIFSPGGVPTLTGTLDLGVSELKIAGSATTVNSLTAYLKAGLNAAGHGYWNGAGGIISTAAATDPTFLSTLGIILDTGNNAIVNLVPYGDADLNNTLNGADYTQIDHGFAMNKTGWANGDFNYDGVVDGTDFALIDNAFNQLTAGAHPAALIAAPQNIFAVAPQIQATEKPKNLPSAWSLYIDPVA